MHKIGKINTGAISGVLSKGKAAAASLGQNAKNAASNAMNAASKGKNAVSGALDKGSDITKGLSQTELVNMAQDSDTSEYDDLSAKDLIGEIESYDQVELPRNAVIKFLSVISLFITASENSLLEECQYLG